ncbi:hypothetical protein D7147_05290 [Micromonospora musae]|uniref:Uncharacterized protein n=1 Tax=Micromonospora musae TaxID=1894970 RepID=A0A3A9Y8E4_9ACTN|nr:hypothetical protein D7147_05290 [Micromonospora musae]RKN33890.1 hypothetical protein D7044_09260 [Micromonospora musae]
MRRAEVWNLYVVDIDLDVSDRGPLESLPAMRQRVTSRMLRRCGVSGDWPNMVDGSLNALQNDRVTAGDVCAEDSRLGNHVHVSPQFATRVVRLSSIEPRANDIKLIGSDDDGVGYSLGFRPRAMALRVQSASLPDEAA